MKPSTLQGLSSLQSLPKHELVELLQYGESRALDLNEVLIPLGSKVQTAYLLAQGGLVAELPSNLGSHVVGKIWPGEVAGEGALSHGYWTSSVQVRAVVPSKVLLLTPELFAKTRGTRAHAALQGHLIGVLAKRIQGTNLQLRKAWLEQEACGNPADTFSGFENSSWSSLSPYMSSMAIASQGPVSRGADTAHSTPRTNARSLPGSLIFIHGKEAARLPKHEHRGVPHEDLRSWRASRACSS